MSNHDQTAKTIGRYVVQSLLGEGAMGSVYKAFDPVIKRVVAIKTIKLDQSRNEIDQKEFVQRFFQEAQISGILNHPNIVSIYDIGEQDGMPYIAMEYVEGRNLNQVINDQERPDLVYLAQIIVQVSNALEFAHGKGVVHRDLKPGNIMVMPNGIAKIMDFGIAKMSGSHLTQTGVFLGTPSFASPEQIKEGQVDHRSDIFSLGILAHETLTGHTPFPGQSISAILYKIANEPPTPAPNLKDLPVEAPKWRMVFDKVFQKEPGKRYQNAGDFGRDLLSSMTFTNQQEVALGTFVGQVNATVRDAFGIQKDIQRSDFEKSQAPPRPIIAKQPKKRSSLMGLLVVLLLVSATALVLFKTGVIGDGERLSSIVNIPDILPSKHFEKMVAINSTPQGATIFVDDQAIEFTTPHGHLVVGDVGTTVTIRLELDAYEPISQSLVLGEEMPSAINLDLVIKPLIRSITTSPAGAELSVNGAKLGPSPAEFSFTPQEQYRIEASLEGYDGYEMTYEEGKSPVADLDIRLSKTQPPGTVKVDSSLQDLKLTVNGKTYNNSAVLPAGTYEVRLQSRKYFFDSRTRVTVRAGETHRLDVPPVVTIGRIDVLRGYAQVKIDGREVDFTPIRNLEIVAGMHTFEFVDDDGKMINQIKRDVVGGDDIVLDN
ncbi:MAG: serine/threonine protein kinase [Acidobacteria bacterium]|nr:serine/threonine protein kinase [Acidobacteriota bacterium]